MINRYVQHILIFAFLVGIVVNTNAQRYKDIYPTIASASDDDALPILKQFMIRNMDHPGANLKMALIYDRRYKQADILTEYEKAIANAERAQLVLTNTGQLISEKDIKKYPAYYSDFSQGMDSKGKPIVEYSTVSRAIIDKHDSIVVFMDKVPPIYNVFVKSVISYDRAIKIFAEINNQYGSLDELFMLYDEDLSGQLEELKKAYDSTILYLDEYKKRIAEYPVNGYKQQYNIKDIETYRLSGLITQSDFLSNSIQLWNYGKWVDDVNEVMNTDITSLRAKIVAYENELNESLNKASNPALYSTFEPLKRNKELLFTLKKYDSRSLLVGVFQYKNYLQTLKHKAHGELYYDTAQNVSVETKYTYYSEMINGHYLGDSMLSVSKVRLTPESASKHQQFIDQHFNGYAGMQQYVGQEHETMTAQFDKYILSLRNSIIDQINEKSVVSTTEAKYRRLKIPLSINDTTAIDSLKNGALMTVYRMESADGSIYVAGAYKKPSKLNNIVAYVLRVAPDKKVSWYKEYNIAIDSAAADANNWAASLALNPEGCAVMIRSAHLQNQIYANTLIYINELGEEKLVKRIEAEDYPRALNYAESTNSFVITLKGVRPEQEGKVGQDLVVLNVNVLGDQLWRYSDSFSGTVERVINTNNGYMITGNFTAKKNHTGTMVRTKINENQTLAYVDVVSKTGKRLNTLLISSPKSYFIKEVVKVNDGNINLLGLMGNYQMDLNRKLDYSNNLVHVITNSKLKVIHNSME